MKVGEGEGRGGGRGVVVSEWCLGSGGEGVGGAPGGLTREA